jgi:alanine racemase
MGSPPSRDLRGAVGVNRVLPLQRATRRAWAEIDLGALQENVRAIAAALRKPARVMAVVKADAYGHGAPAAARAAVEAGAVSLGVATTDEGVQLRAAGLDVPILLLGHTSAEEAEVAVANDLSVTVFQIDVARALSRAAARAGRPARVQVKIDTGMGRIGIAPAEGSSFVQEACRLPGIVLEGCFTHFATADDADLAPARAQLEAFCAVLQRLDEAGLRVGLRHAANSAAAIALPESHLDLVRPGIALYGILPAPHLGSRISLRRVMRLRARVTHVKRVPAGTPIGYGGVYRGAGATTIATIPVGYADGYPRLLSGRGEVSLAGRRVPLAGRISMDQCTVDAGETAVRVGDEVELWGEQVPVEDVAEQAQTIAYELLAGVSRRVPRVFVRNGEVVGIRTLLSDDGEGTR